MHTDSYTRETTNNFIRKEIRKFFKRFNSWEYNFAKTLDIWTFAMNVEGNVTFREAVGWVRARRVEYKIWWGYMTKSVPLDDIQILDILKRSSDIRALEFVKVLIILANKRLIKRYLVLIYMRCRVTLWLALKIFYYYSMLPKQHLCIIWIHTHRITLWVGAVLDWFLTIMMAYYS